MNIELLTENIINTYAEKIAKFCIGNQMPSSELEFEFKEHIPEYPKRDTSITTVV